MYRGLSSIPKLGTFLSQDKGVVEERSLRTEARLKGIVECSEVRMLV